MSSGDWIQIIMLAWYTLYLLNHPISNHMFCLKPRISICLEWDPSFSCVEGLVEPWPHCQKTELFCLTVSCHTPSVPCLMSTRHQTCAFCSLVCLVLTVQLGFSTHCPSALFPTSFLVYWHNTYLFYQTLY